MKNPTAGSPGDVHEEFEAAKKAVLEAYANFLDAKLHLKKAAVAAGIDLRDSATEQFDEALTRARDKKNEIHDSASDYVRENPVTSAGIAFLGGVIFSRMFGK
jgi:ElaB/YqjD/DUF883 family membrane-anchored ribosome-binding protein